jgi:REP-associated tyrosine transposase
VRKVSKEEFSVTFDPQKHHRRSIRLPDYDYSGPGAYFITMVTSGRECLFGEIEDGQIQLSAMGQIAEEHWCLIPEHFPSVELGAYVIMPNHVHGIIIIHENGMAANSPPPVGATHWVAPTVAPTTDIRTLNGPKRGSIGAIIGSYKMSVTRRIQRELNATDVWQRNYYEHIIRDDEEHNRIHLYIESNVANWVRDDENSVKFA